MKLLWGLALLCVAQDELSKERHHWMKYKVGTSVTFKLTMTAGEQKMDGTMKQTLTDLKDKQYTVKSSFDMAGQQNEEDEVEDLPTKSGEESLKVGDKEYKCTIYTTKSKRGEKEATNRVWLAEGVKPPLKLEIKEGDKVSTIVAQAVDEKVKAGDKEYECVRLEGDMPTDMGQAKAKFWMTGDVPGMAVKLSMDIKGDQGDMKMEFEATQVDIK